MLRTDTTNEGSRLNTRMDDAHLNLNVMRKFFSGIIAETFDARLSSDGAKITLALTASNGANLLTLVFSDGATVFDLTGTKGVIDTDGILVAGSDTSPQKNYVYILQSTKVLTVSASSFPTEEHIRIGFFFIPSATFVLAHGGGYVNQNINDHVEDSTTKQGHLAHIGARTRAQSAIYKSGAALTISVTGGGSVVDFALTSATVFQFHPHVVVEMDTTAGDPILVVNQDGANYEAVTDLENLTNDANGNPLSKYFNQYLWAAANKTGQYSGWFMNLPTGSYVRLNDAINDIDGHDVATLPAEFNIDSSTGFFIARLTWQLTAGVWTLERHEDLRGQTPASVAGGGVGVAQTEFVDNQFLIIDNIDNSKELAFQLDQISTGQQRIITMADQNIDLTPGSGTYPSAADVLLKDGSVALTAPWAADNDITGLTKLVVDDLQLDGHILSSSSTIELMAMEGNIDIGYLIELSASEMSLSTVFDITLTSSDGSISLSSNVNINANYLDWDEMTAPGNPGANVARMYCKDDTGTTKLFFRDSAGAETEMGGGGTGVSIHGLLNGLDADDHTQYLLVDGTRALSSDWDAGSFKITAEQLESDVAGGTPPLIITSTTMVTNLNAEALGGSTEESFVLYAGRSGGSTINGGTDASDDLTLKATSDETQGFINLGSEMDAGAHTIGFTQQTVTYDSGTTTVDWKLGNKAKMTFGAGDITTFAFTNPTNQCNFMLIIKQDGTGSRVVTAWDADIIWAGGVIPTLSTGANAIDAISFYWDGTNYLGQAALNFS